MSYIDEFENEFRKRLEGTDDTNTLVRWVSEKLLQSYRNGITAGEKGKTVIRQGQSRRRGTSGKAK